MKTNTAGLPIYQRRQRRGAGPARAKSDNNSLVRGRLPHKYQPIMRTMAANAATKAAPTPNLLPLKLNRFLPAKLSSNLVVTSDSDHFLYAVYRGCNMFIG